MAIPSGTKGQLRFEFVDLAQEIEVLRSIARPFIDPKSVRSLHQLSEDLEGLWSAAPNRDLQWQLGDLWTMVSDGEYEPGDRKGARQVLACISGTWDVRPVGVSSQKVKERQKRLLEFYGRASTRVRLFHADDTSTQFAMWRMELGDANSPGCYFHVQVLGEEEVPPFPLSVSVPRFPTVFVTPMGALEFVFGELFQDRWAKTVMENSSNVQRWNGFQRRRLRQLLKWQCDTVENTLTSPWIALKTEKPDATLFLAS